MKILFICKGNMVRSQAAAAIYNRLTKTYDAISAGTYVGADDEPEGRRLSDILPSDFFEIMDGYGCDLRNETTKKLTPEMIASADYVISMAEEPYIPDFLRDEKVIVWDIPNVATNENIKTIYENVANLLLKINHFFTYLHGTWNTDH